MSLNNNTTSLESILSTVNALPDKVDTTGTATAEDIYTGKTATVSDVKITGTNPYNAATVDPEVTDILAALTEKGVDTTGAGLADIAALVAAIEAGGGAKIVRGTVTQTEKGIMNIEHNLNAVPQCLIMYPTAAQTSSDALMFGVIFIDIENSTTSTRKGPYWKAVKSSSSPYYTIKVNDLDIGIACNIFGSGELPSIGISQVYFSNAKINTTHIGLYAMTSGEIRVNTTYDWAVIG